MTASAFPRPPRYAIYTGRATNWPMVALTAALTAPLLLMARTAQWTVPLLIVAAAMLTNLLTATSIRTAAGPNGVVVRFGVLGWPRCAYRLDRIARAEVVDLSPWRVSYGFWWTPTRTSCTVRPGPALRLTLHSGRTVTITVPDPRAAASAVEEARPA